MESELGVLRKGAAFELLSETGGSLVIGEAASMIVTRYVLAAELGRDQRVLEIACAGGMGTGLLRESAASVVAGDINGPLLRLAAAAAPSDVCLVQFDAAALPFASASFDFVLCMECTYYINDTEALFTEISRVLARDGKLLIVNANPRRPDFITSPLSASYHAPFELAEDLGRRGFTVSVWGAFPVMPREAGTIARLIAAASRSLRAGVARLGLVPTTLGGRARLKRLVHWRLTRLPPLLLRTTAPLARLEPITSQSEENVKVYYALAAKGTHESPALPPGFHSSTRERTIRLSQRTHRRQ